MTHDELALLQQRLLSDSRLTARLESIHPVPLERNALVLTPATVDRLLTEAQVFRP